MAKGKNRKREDAKQDEVEILRSEAEGFGTIAEGYRSNDKEKKEKEET